MDNLDVVFDTTPIEEAISIEALKNIYNDKTELMANTFKQLTKENNDLVERKNKLMTQTSKVGRFFGGITGNEDVKELNQVKSSLENIEGIENRLNQFSDELDRIAGYQGYQILARENEEVAKLCDYHDLLDEACNRTEEVLVEIDEALAALNDAEEAEEWDQWTDNGWAEMESDDANRRASYEVDDVNRVLVGYRDFLNGIGQSAHSLMGPDFQFNWYDAMMEDTWSDFWGSEGQLERIAQAQNQMISLRNRIADLFNQFATDFDATDSLLQEYLNDAWSNGE